MPNSAARSGGQLIDWLVCATALVTAASALLLSNAMPRSGAPMSFEITVVPSDESNLACAGNEAIGDARCGFDERGAPRASTGGDNFRPYVTTRREVVLLEGVFEEPHVVAWRTDSARRGSAGRVTLRCTGDYLGQTGGVAIRWLASQSFIPERDLLVGRVRACTVASS